MQYIFYFIILFFYCGTAILIFADLMRFHQGKKIAGSIFWSIFWPVLVWIFFIQSNFKK
jgi:hypothetical protein